MVGREDRICGDCAEAERVAAEDGADQQADRVVCGCRDGGAADRLRTMVPGRWTELVAKAGPEVRRAICLRPAARWLAELSDQGARRKRQEMARDSVLAHVVARADTRTAVAGGSCTGRTPAVLSRRTVVGEEDMGEAAGRVGSSTPPDPRSGKALPLCSDIRAGVGLDSRVGAPKPTRVGEVIRSLGGRGAAIAAVSVAMSATAGRCRRQRDSLSEWTKTRMES